MNPLYISSLVLLGCFVVAATGWWVTLRKTKELQRDIEQQARNYVGASGLAHNKQAESEQLRSALSQSSIQNHRYQEALALHQQALSLLDIELTETPRAWLSADERGRSQEMLFQLQIASRAEAAAIGTSDGLPILYSGDRDESDALTATIALLAKGQHAWQQGLAAPWATFSWGTSREGMHLMALQNSDMVLGITGPHTAPWETLQRTRLQLIGRPHLQLVQQQQRASTSSDRVFGTQSQELADKLLNWQQQQRVDAVALFAPDGVPLASTEAPQHPTVGLMAPYIAPMLRRVWLKGWAQDDLTIRISSQHNHLVVRPVENGLQCRYIMALANQPVTERALDALMRALRWSLAQNESTLLHSAA